MHNKACSSILIATVSFGLLAAGTASARVPLRSIVATPIVDLVDIVLHNHEAIAIDASPGGRTHRVHLMFDEDVLWVGARGTVGVVITDKRVLGITTGWRGWRELRFKIHEARPRAVLLGERVALVVTDRRVIGISSGGPKFFQTLIGTNEEPLDVLVSENTAVLVTDRRLLGVSGFIPGVFETRVGVHEDLEYASTLPNFVTIGTDDRVLVFRAATASWAAERVTLHR